MYFPDHLKSPESPSNYISWTSLNPYTHQLFLITSTDLWGITYFYKSHFDCSPKHIFTMCKIILLFIIISANWLGTDIRLTDKQLPRSLWKLVPQQLSCSWQVQGECRCRCKAEHPADTIALWILSCIELFSWALSNSEDLLWFALARNKGSTKHPPNSLQWTLMLKLI